MAALVSIFGLITSPAELQNFLHIIESLLPSEARDLINNELQRIIVAQGNRLGWGAFRWHRADFMERGQSNERNVCGDEHRL
jgi:uncharacterized BrkB/YihY/UPF0761 family membrane protein